MSTEADFKTAYDLINKSQTIAIVGHIRPDGDCVGSALALNSVLEEMGKTVSIFFDDEIPKQFDYLEGFEKIQNDALSVDEVVYDLLIIVDLNSADRLGRFGFLRERCNKVICFDHHIGFNIEDVDVVVSRTDYASCGEIIYKFFVANNIKMNKQIADALYTSVSTDTGCFLYPATTSSSHIIAAELMNLGCDFEKINYLNFQVYDPVIIKGLRQILRHLRLRCGGQLSYSRLRNGKMFDAGARHKLKQYITDIKGVRVSILILQEGRRYYHVSLRSHGDVNVGIPAKHFGGGGHKNASGFTISGKYKKVVKQIVAEVEKQIANL